MSDLIPVTDAELSNIVGGTLPRNPFPRPEPDPSPLFR